MEPGTENRNTQNKKQPLTFRADDRMIFTGRPRTGKTTLMKYIASLVPTDQLMIVDPLDQYEGFSSDVKIIPLDVNPREEFNAIARQVMHQGNITLIVEEAQRYIPEGERLGIDTMALLNRGRNYGVGVWASTTRIATISKNLYDLCSMIGFFRPGFTSRKYIKGSVPREVYDATIHLPNGHFVYYSLETEVWGVANLRIPPETTAAELAKGIPESARIEVEETHQS